MSTPPTTSAAGEPRTEAGRDLLKDARRFWSNLPASRILAIEAEATRTALEGVAERVRKLHRPEAFWAMKERVYGFEVCRRAVLALLDAER